MATTPGCGEGSALEQRAQAQTPTQVEIQRQEKVGISGKFLKAQQVEGRNLTKLKVTHPC